MAAIDDITGERRNGKPVRVTPPPVDVAIEGGGVAEGANGINKANRTDGAIRAYRANEAIRREDPTRRLSYTEMFEKMFPNKPETKEEREAREKKERRQKTIAAIGDGISALSNLFFATRYAPVKPGSAGVMSARTRERWEKLKQEREASDRAYLDGYLRARSMDEAREREDWNRNHTMEREKVADERYEAQAASEREAAELRRRLTEQQIAKAESDARTAAVTADFAELQQRANLEYRQAGTDKRNAEAGTALSRSEYYRNGGANGSGPTLQLEDDEPLRFGNYRDYDRAVMRLAADYGIPTTEVEVIERDYKGNPKKQRTKERAIRDIAADIEREAARRKGGRQQQQTTAVQTTATPSPFAPESPSQPTQKPSQQGMTNILSGKWSNTSNIQW